MRSAVPPMLRTAIDRCVRDPSRIVASTEPGSRDVPRVAADLVVLAQREDQDEVALKGICEFVLRQVRAARADHWTADAGPASMVLSTGAGLPTQCGERALDAGIVIGPETVQSGCELASPIRLGARVVAALAVRWPADREALSSTISRNRGASRLGSGTRNRSMIPEETCVLTRIRTR
jgi:hypothetical protein